MSQYQNITMPVPAQRDELNGRKGRVAIDFNTCYVHLCLFWIENENEVPFCLSITM